MEKVAYTTEADAATTTKTSEPPRISRWKIGKADPKNNFDVSQALLQENQPLIGLPLPKQEFHLFSPDAVRHVLSTKSENYVKDHWGYQRLTIALGLGLLTAEGDLWRRHRKVIQPVFHRNNYPHFAEQIVASTSEYIQSWHKQAQGFFRKPLDIEKAMGGLTLTIALDILLRGSAKQHLKLIRKAVDAGNDYVANTILTYKLWPTWRNFKFRWLAKQADKVLVDIIKERQQQHAVGNNNTKDLLDLLIQAQDPETGAKLNDQELLDEVKTMIITGHETMATVLTWAWFFVAQNKNIMEKLAAEVNAVVGSRLPTFDDVNNLVYCKMVMQESMRYYPPIWGIWRRAIKRDVICGYKIPRDADIFISTYAIHHNPAYWQQPDEFIPERFAPENADNIVKYTYLPFGAGPRTCIAFDFALMEGVLTIATIVQQYRLLMPLTHSKVSTNPLITLKPKQKIKLRVQQAHGN